MTDFRMLRNAEAAAVEADEVVRLTRRATRTTFYADGLTPRQIATNRRIPILARQAYFGAAESGHQHLVAAFAGARMAGFMIATRHRSDDLELDWMIVDPGLHGRGLAAALMREGMDWLGADRPLWLTVIRHNRRAISFYRKFGFEIDERTELDRPVPTWIMRKAPAGPARLPD